jgi:leader peptidase (prepilin peptidase)/N-methyltransferase
VSFFELLEANPALFVALAAVVGAIVGSFLNVVIHRLPIMLQREWRAQCAELLEIEATDASQDRFNLVTPRSRCPHCGHQITALENIPILSYLVLQGKCSECGRKISARYPIVEGVTALLSAVAAWHFGFGWGAAAALLLTWALIALTVIDFEHQLLPDVITYPFLWLGLGLSLFPLFADTRDAIIGAMAGYLSLWTFYQLFKLLTGKEGMGYGDFKLLALIGAWMGWQALPVTIILSSVVGAVVGVGMIAIRGHDRSIPIPFGPYLAAAGWLALLWGDEITGVYLRWAGLAS